jgi:hypothetical protein
MSLLERVVRYEGRVKSYKKGAETKGQLVLNEISDFIKMSWVDHLCSSPFLTTACTTSARKMNRRVHTHSWRKKTC